MENKRGLKIIISLFVICATAMFFVAQVFFDWTSFDYEENKLYVHVLDVGQGDAIFIRTPQAQNILIDAGPDNAIIEPISNILGFGLHEFDYVFLTHPHSDHISGLIELLERYKINEIWYTGVLHNTPVFVEMLKSVKKSGAQINIINEKAIFDIGGGATIEVLYPQKDISEKENWIQNNNGLNDTSLIMKLVFGESSILFVGDAEAAEEKFLFESGVDLRCDILKIGHHGSRSSTSEEFLTAVNPKYAVISSGENEFGHPHAITLRKLRSIPTFRTDKNGTITFILDEKNIEIITEF